VLIFGKESKERGKRKLLDKEGKRIPSLLNLAPTTVQGRVSQEVEDYWE